MREDPENRLDEDTIFDIVSNRRRRFVLTYLARETTPVQLTEIATALAAAESDTPPEQVDKRARKRAYVSLYQTHVPRLVDKGIVEYDEASGQVTPLPSADEVLSYIGGNRPSSWWPRVYFVLAVVGLLVYLPPLAGVGPERVLLAGVFVPLGVLVASITHWRSATA